MTRDMQHITTSHLMSSEGQEFLTSSKFVFTSSTSRKNIFLLYKRYLDFSMAHYDNLERDQSNTPIEFSVIMSLMLNNDLGFLSKFMSSEANADTRSVISCILMVKHIEFGFFESRWKETGEKIERVDIQPCTNISDYLAFKVFVLYPVFLLALKQCCSGITFIKTMLAALEYEIASVFLILAESGTNPTHLITRSEYCEPECTRRMIESVANSLKICIDPMDAMCEGKLIAASLENVDPKKMGFSLSPLITLIHKFSKLDDSSPHSGSPIISSYAFYRGKFKVDEEFND